LAGISFAILVMKIKRGARLEPKKKHILDLRDIIAPVTFLKVTQELETLKPGEILEILAKDPETRQELFKVLKPFHYQLMGIEEESSFYRIRLLRE
jgi:TusA-related sulfurtransferase